MYVEASRTESIGLDELVERLGRAEQVLGVLEIGSFAAGGGREESDFDLVIVCEDLAAAPHVGLTTVQGRLTDLVFVDAAELDRIREAGAALDPTSWAGRLVIWLREGRLRHDPTGRLAEAARRAGAEDALRPIGEDEAYAAWFSLQYNLAQTRRMLASEDPSYRSAAELRMCWHGLSDLLGGYRSVRRLRWAGEKDALRWLEAEDPAYAAGLQRFLRAASVERRFELYEALASEAAAPLGPLWPDSFSAFLPGEQDGSLRDRLRESQAWWSSATG